ncbi:MAG: hemagglutinin repeat-containing protein, partial [Glaciimonas sp.]|nr:hemagglutinin repeat-containing protein [Glaciimonas sp.]
VSMESVTSTVSSKNGINVGISKVASVNADQLSIQSGRDINLKGTAINTTADAALVAGRDINLGTVTTQVTSNVRYDDQNHLNESQAQVSGTQIKTDGNLTMAAGQDINANAANVNAGQALTAAAGRDVNITSAQQTYSKDQEIHTSSSGFMSSSSSHMKDQQQTSQAVGSSLTGNSIAIVSGRDATIQGSQVIAKEDVTMNAGRDLNIVSAQDTHSGSYSLEEKKSGLSASVLTGVSYNNTAQDQHQNGTSTNQIGSSISGANVNMVSGRDTTITASAITADKDVGIYAGRNVNVLAAANTESSQTDSHSSGTSIGIAGGANGRFTNFSKTSAEQNGSGTATSQSTSLISANGGNLNLQAGLDNQYKGTGQGNVVTQGAELLAKNNASIAGNAVDLQAVQNATSSKTHSETHSVTLGSSLTGAIGGAITRIGDQVTEAQNTDNDRLKGALALKSGYDAYKLASGGQISSTTAESLDPNPQNKSGGGFGVSVNLGTSQSKQDSSNSATQSRGTTVQAGNIDVTAREGDITMEGEKLQAQNIALDAAKNINLIAAKNTSDLQSSNSGSSAGIGATLGSNGQQTGLSFQIGGSMSKGHANGSETTYDNTQITATDNLTIKSGGNTNLIGAQLAANKVKADIGGNLNIVTLQDQSNYDSKQENGGFSLSLCLPPICVGTTATGSINYGKQTVDHNYQSAVGQSGIAAGNGGFDLNVKGNTDLVGSAITSTADADKNRLQTASLTSSDLINSQHTKSDSISFGLSTNGIASNLAANAISSLNSGAGLPKDGDQSSHTNSVISPANVVITGTGDAAKDAQSQANADTLTSRDAATANETLANTLTLQQAQELQAQQKKAQENQRAADLAGAALNGMVGDIAKSQNFAEGSPEKIAMHGIVGLIQASIGGTSAVGGIVAGMSVEAMSPIISNYLLNNGYDTSTPEGLKAYNEMMGLGATLVGAASGAIAGGSQQSAGAGAVIGQNADANNRKLHQKEIDLIKQNASRFAKEYYKTDKPTPGEIQGAMALLANTAQNLLDYNLGYDVPYSAQAEKLLHTLQSEYAATNPNLSIGNGQYLFYATNDQKNSPYINSGTVDKEIAGVIIKAPIKQPETAASNAEKRDPATNLVLDTEGRYSQQYVVDGKSYSAKYFPCPTASAGCGGNNMDMSDPQTAAFMKVMQKKSLDEINTGATVATIISPIGVFGTIAAIVGTATSIGSGLVSDTTGQATAKEIGQAAAQKYLESVYGLPAAAAVRITALVDLAGGWSALVSRANDEIQEKKNANTKP